ncbi:hypothetical protein Vretimale_3444 [Volvox reticuliferus]|uniref:Defective in cullin neddylation protein n=2 Tax=Volvox reticuliferus TaxID=1737510 RepID=A0A8J4D932_9CHLO|nr:hypothetical protein Vretifemale_953 [Volvox reticuliferus]GIL98042.1 hypothetical protein Vretimale_3444 [Volvox reticuliferus]
MATCDAMFLLLHEAFIAFDEVLTNEGRCWEACKTKVQQLQEQWHQRGLFGITALNIITQYKAQIKWQDMSPDQFGKFYRFVFHVCREFGKRNLQMNMAVAAWRLILPGRFRLLERWCSFAAASSVLVVTQDLWRQVLDFSRTVHEDLSNFDSAGSWAVLLDEFVEDMRTTRRRSYGGPDSGGFSDRLKRRESSGAELSTLFVGGAAGRCGFLACCDGDIGSGSGFMGSMSPRCGSKRRGPDVDIVTEQLSAMPLGVGQQQQQHHHCIGIHGPSCAIGRDPNVLLPVQPCSQSRGAVQLNSATHGYIQEASPYTEVGDCAAYCHNNDANPVAKRQCAERQLQLQNPHPHQSTALLPTFSLGRVGPMGAVGEGAPLMCGGSTGNGTSSGRTASGGQSMICSTGSLDGGGSQAGSTGSATMDCWLQVRSSRTG